MSIQHHPEDDMLAGFAAGVLDPGQHIAIATHLSACPHCRDFAGAMEQAGGVMLETLPPAAMSQNALAAVERRLDEPVPPPVAVRAAHVSADELPGLPGFLRHYRFGNWRWVAPSVYVRPIELPHPSPTRVFLLKSGPETQMLEHAHTGIEMTCVLTGAFRQDNGRYGPGDFDWGNDAINHRPLVESGQDCICLVAMQGELQLKGLVGRLIQPFIRL